MNNVNSVQLYITNMRKQAKTHSKTCKGIVSSVCLRKRLFLGFYSSAFLVLK